MTHELPSQGGKLETPKEQEREMSPIKTPDEKAVRNLLDRLDHHYGNIVGIQTRGEELDESYDMAVSSIVNILHALGQGEQVSQIIDKHSKKDK